MITQYDRKMDEITAELQNMVADLDQNEIAAYSKAVMELLTKESGISSIMVFTVGMQMILNTSKDLAEANNGVSFEEIATAFAVVIQRTAAQNEPIVREAVQ